MSKDLYVRNITLTATEEDVKKLFSVVGKVSYIHMVKDTKTGEFKGCAYVKMSSDAEAREALTSLDGARLINRIIAVREALPQKPAAGKTPAERKHSTERKETGDRWAEQGKKPGGRRK